MRRRWVLHPDEVAVLDANAEALGVPADDLMVDAATHMLRDLWFGVESGQINGDAWILCGPGNNGGDGYRLACMLENISGILNPIVIATHASQKTELSQRARDDFGSEVHLDLPEGRPDVIIDCLLGVGSHGPPRGKVLDLMESLSQRLQGTWPKILSCDIPTGMGTNFSFAAQRTITFEAPKIGMFDSDGRLLPEVGNLIIHTLDWPEETLDLGPGEVLRYPPINVDSTKGERGRVLVIGGGPYHGAPLLAGIAAARMGCDLVHVAMPSSAVARARWPSGLIPEQIPDVDFLSMESLSHITERCTTGRGVQSVVIGPGLGDSEETLDAVRTVIQLCIDYAIPIVIDADGIKALPEGIWPAGLIGVATPHSAEREQWLSNVSPGGILDTAAKLSAWLQTDEAAENAVVVTTGSRDILHGIAGRECSLSGGNPRMAMGGTGDILAGCIGGLLATGMSPWAAARLGCWVLRKAGERAGDEIGPGLQAEDVTSYLSQCLK